MKSGIGMCLIQKKNDKGLRQWIAQLPWFDHYPVYAFIKISHVPHAYMQQLGTHNN